MNSKSRFKAGLGFGVAMTACFIFQNLLRDNQTTNQIISSIIAGLIGGALSGLLFGWSMGRFIKSKFVVQSTKIETAPGENILLETSAIHFKGLEGVGGKLYLTNQRVIFKSHKLNIQTHELSINLNDIKEVHKYKTLGVVNKGLSITLTNNMIEKFIVEEVEEWVRQLRPAELGKEMTS